MSVRLINKSDIFVYLKYVTNPTLCKQFSVKMIVDINKYFLQFILIFTYFMFKLFVV